MRGCPNRCRHCSLGSHPNGNMTEDDLRWAVAQFRDYIQQEKPFIESLKVSSWMREPDFSDDYERLAELEAELGNGKPNRYELLSIWRLARDEKYAEWAKKVGPDTCQISFFGMEETNDWFYRRRGAFQDCIKATERLLDVGMKPRWQLFLTKKIIPELGDLLNLIEQLKIKERMQGEFVLFMHPPGLEGEGMKIAHLSATLEDTKLIPDDITESTKKHFGKDKVWVTEAESVSEFLYSESGLAPAYPYPSPMLYFFIISNWDVYSNMGTLQPWWKLGNLKKDSVQTIFDNFESDRIPALRANYSVTIRKLAQRYGDPNSQAVVNSVEAKWLADYCEEVLRGSAGMQVHQTGRSRP